MKHSTETLFFVCVDLILQKMEFSELIGYYVIFTISFGLLALSAINLQRYCVATQSVHEFGLIRHLLVICIILQISVYIGYSMDDIIVITICWTTWMPLSLFCLIHLCITIAKSYASIMEELDCGLFYCAKYLIYTLGILASLADIIGTIVGYVLENSDILSMSWLAHEICTCLAITCIILLLYFVRTKLNARIYDLNDHMVTTSQMKLTHSVYKILRIIICLIVIMAFYITAIITSFLKLSNINFPIIKSEIIHTSLMGLLDFIIFILIHSFILIYTWIPIQKPKPAQQRELIVN